MFPATQIILINILCVCVSVCLSVCLGIKKYLRGSVSRHPDHFAWLEPEGGTFAFVKLLLLRSVVN